MSYELSCPRKSYNVTIHMKAVKQFFLTILFKIVKRMKFLVSRFWGKSVKQKVGSVKSDTKTF